MESGIRTSAAQLENRQRRFGLRLHSLLQGNQAREVTSGRPDRLDSSSKTPTATRAGENSSARRVRDLDTELLQEEEAEARAGAGGKAAARVG